jgi:alkylation response protein AidB-like acyl-CoA dehydrogenase
MIAHALDDLLAGRLTEAAIRRIEAQGGDADVWQSVASSGFPDLLLDEEAGGAGLGLQEAFELFLLLGRRIMPLPLAATWVARRILPASHRPEGVLAIASGAIDGRGWLSCRQVPGGRSSAHVLVHFDDELLLMPVSETRHRSDIGDPRSLSCRIEWETRHALWRSPTGGRAAQSWMAAAMAAQIAGALDRILAVTLEHCNQRQQFGKPIGQFQAVQHQLSVMAEQVLAAHMAAELAFAAGDAVPPALNAAIAKARSSEAVTQVCAAAHALHGAIGMTDEYALGLHTRRAQQWRLDHGSEVHWQRLIGEHVLASDRTVGDVISAL